MSNFTPAKAKWATFQDRWVSLNSRPFEISLLYLATRISRVLSLPGLGVLISDAGLMRSVLMDGEHFSKTAEGGTSELWDPILQGPGLLNMSGEAHLDLKRKLTPLFSSRYLQASVGAAVKAETARLEAVLLSGQPVDIVRSIEVTAARVICGLSGYDLAQTGEPEALEQLERARGLLRFVKLGTRRLSQSQIEAGLEELAELRRNIHLAFDLDREDTIPHILKGFGLSRDEVTAVITSLVIAGTETVLSHLPRFTALLIRSGYLGEIAEGADLDLVVQEGLRVTVPTPVMLRGVVAETNIRGRLVRPGDRILMATVFACQRLGHFNPSRPMPKEYRHIWFGAGVHMCIGLPLANLEILEYLEMFVRVNRARPIHITSAKVRRGTLTAGYQKLEIACQLF
jgi:cytochrome P450